MATKATKTATVKKTTKKATVAPTAEVGTKEALKATIDKLVAQWNESAEFSEFKVMKTLEGKIAENVEKYTAECEGECFVELKKAANPMLEAAKMLTFNTIAVKDEKEKGADGKPTGRTKKVVRSVERRIDPLRLHKCTNEGIGADHRWIGMIEDLNMLLTIATAVELNAVNGNGEKLDPAKIRANFMRSDEAKQIAMKCEENPCNDVLILQDVQDTIDAMIGKGYEATPVMVNYLRRTHEKGGRDPMSVVCTNARSMRQYMLDVCNAAITGDDFTLGYKEAKQA